MDKDKGKFPIDNPRRLKDWINNVAKKNKLAASVFPLTRQRC
jgi:hypothetical protein